MGGDTNTGEFYSRAAKYRLRRQKTFIYRHIEWIVYFLLPIFFKKLTIEAEICFIKLASYKGSKSTGHVVTAIGLDTEVFGQRRDNLLKI